MKTRPVDSQPMPLSRSLLQWFVIVAASPAFSAEPAPKVLSEPFPIAPASPAKPPAAPAEQVLPRDDSEIRPAGKPSLLPDEIPSYAKPPAGSAPLGAKKETSTPPLTSTASELDLRIRYRKARNIAEANENVRAAWDESRVTRTDDGKRRALKRYQNLLYAKMLSVDKGIAPLVEQRRKAESYLLEQTSITPTVPAE